MLFVCLKQCDNICLDAYFCIPIIPSICTSGLRAAGPRLVGDGGAAWRRKALLRATEQAKEAGVSVEEFVKDRWGVRECLAFWIFE